MSVQLKKKYFTLCLIYVKKTYDEKSRKRPTKFYYLRPLALEKMPNRIQTKNQGRTYLYARYARG